MTGAAAVIATATVVIAVGEVTARTVMIAMTKARIYPRHR